MNTQEDVCISMFTAALFTIAKKWEQPKCSSTQEWINKMWYTCTIRYYSTIKKNEIMPFAATWMDLETVILSEVCQTQEKYHVLSLICAIYTNEFIYTTETDSHRLLRTNNGCQGERWGEG